MKRVFFFALCALMACTESEIKAHDALLSTIMSEAIAGDIDPTASIITDKFISIGELGVIIRRPAGTQWRITKKIQGTKERPVADVEIMHKCHGSMLNVIVSPGQPEEIERHVQMIVGIMVTACGSPPEVMTTESQDGAQVWMYCDAKRQQGEKILIVSAVRTVILQKRKIPGRIITVMGLWAPANDEEMQKAMGVILGGIAPLIEV